MPINRLKVEAPTTDTINMSRREEAAAGDVAGESEHATMPVPAAPTGEPEDGVKSSEVGFRDLVLEYGGIRIDVKNFRAWVHAEPLELRLMEFALLANLMLTPGELKTRIELSEYLWEEEAKSHSTRTIDVHVQRLRAAVAENSCHDYIRSVRGLGYRFTPPGFGNARSK